MANGRLEQKDVYQKNLFDELKEGAAATETVIKNLSAEISQLAESLKELGIDSAKDIQKVVKAEKQLKEASDATLEAKKLQAKLDAEILKRTKQLADSKSAEAKQISDLKVQQAEANKTLKEESKERLGLLSVYQKQSKKLNDLRKELKDLTLTEGKNSKAVRKLKKEVQALDEELKDVDASAGQFQRNVGNYPQTLAKGAAGLLKFAAAAAGVGGALAGIKTSLEANDEGADDLAAGTGFLEGAMASLKSSAGGLFDNLAKLATGKGSFRSLLSISKLFTKEGLTEVIEKAGKSGEAFSEAAVKSRDLEKAILPLSEKVQDLTNDIAVQNQIAGDNTKSFDEIAAAAKEATRLEIERAKILEDIGRAELAIIEDKIKASSDEQNLLSLQIEATEKRIELSQLANELEVARLDNAKIVREVERDRFERELDFAIDAFDAQKTVNERLIADETKSFDERSKLFMETARLAESSFQSQIDLVESYTKQKIDFDALANESDENVIRQKLKSVTTDDIVLGRILEIIKERKFAQQDLADAERDLREESKENAKEAADFISQLEQEQFNGRIAALEREKELTAEQTKELFELKKAQLEAQSEFDLNLEETTAEEKELIREKLANDLAALAQEEADKLQAIRDEALRKEQEAFDKQIDQYKTFVNQVANLLNTIDQAKANQLQADIASNDKALQSQERRAEQGLNNELNFRRKKDAELAQLEEKRQKREQRRAKILAYFEFLAQNAKTNPDTAAVKSAAQVALAEAISGFFYEGTESVGDGNAMKWRNTGKDDYIAALNKGERVIPTEGNIRIERALGKISNDDLVQMLENHNQRQYIPVGGGMDDSRIVKGLEKVGQSVGNIKVHVDIDSKGMITQTEFREGLKRVIKQRR